MAPKGITALDINRNGTSLCVGTLDGYLISYDLRSLHNDEPMSAARVHDTVVTNVEYLRTTLDEMPSAPVSLNSSSSYNSLSSHIEQTNGNGNGKPPLSSTSHLTVNKHSTVSLYSPENSHVMKPTMTKSFSSSGLIVKSNNGTSSINHTSTTMSMENSMSNSTTNGMHQTNRSVHTIIENCSSSFSKNDSTLNGMILIY